MSEKTKFINENEIKISEKDSKIFSLNKELQVYIEKCNMANTKISEL